MNERFFLKLLLGIFSGLIASELLIVILAGFRLELILFCFIIAVALGGIVVVLRMLADERPEVESVSMRRARAVRDDGMRDRLQQYEIDDEFLSRKSARIDKGIETMRHQPETMSGMPVEQAIRTHADMCGGLSELLEKMESLDDAAFSRLVGEAGFGSISRNDIMKRVRLMVSVKDQETCTAMKRSLDEAIEAFSSDKASFDDYIRRSMSSGQSSMGMDDDAESGFSVQLDAASLSKTGGTMPEDFSHDPRSVIDRLKQKGRPS